MSKDELRTAAQQRIEQYYGGHKLANNNILMYDLMELIDSYAKEAVREADVNETKLIEERDRLEENLDSLTQAVALYFKTDFGEHSSANNPWFNAFKKLRDETIPSEETGGE